jgi:hypothetical protein
VFYFCSQAGLFQAGDVSRLSFAMDESFWSQSHGVRRKE